MRTRSTESIERSSLHHVMTLSSPGITLACVEVSGSQVPGLTISLTKKCNFKLYLKFREEVSNSHSKLIPQDILTFKTVKETGKPAV